MFLLVCGMDLKNKVIIDCLREDGDRTIDDIAQKIQSSKLTAMRHLRQLIATGHIRRSTRRTKAGMSYRYEVIDVQQ